MAATLPGIPLPRLRLASKLEDVELTLQGQISLDLPLELGPIDTLEDLRKAVTERHLWIARIGSCYINIALSVHGELLPDEAKWSELAELVRRCEFWDRLGLRLEYSGDAETNLAGQMTFSIQHPDLSSALVAPGDALVAGFRAVSCSIDISGRAPQPTDTSPKHRDRPRKRAKFENTKKLQDSTGDDELYQCLTVADRRAIDDFVSSLNVQVAADRPSGQVNVTEQSGSTTAIEDAIESENVRDLLQAALRSLVMGTSGRHKGVKVLESTPSDGLKGLMPAVFHMLYLKAVSDRASLLPVIATSLARMSNAESPALRHKTESFTSRVARGRKGSDLSHDDPLVRGVEKAAWETMLASTKPPPFPRRSANRAPSTPVQPGETYHLLRGISVAPTWHFGPFVEDQVMEEEPWGKRYSAEQHLPTKHYPQESPEDCQPLMSSQLCDTSGSDLFVDYTGDGSGFLATFPNSFESYNSPQSEPTFTFGSDTTYTNGSAMHGEDAGANATSFCDPERFNTLDEWLYHDAGPS